MRENLKPQATLTGPLTPARTPFIALVGSPNSGKTTLFNWLTGSRFKTVNYPGATVEYSIGQTQERFGEALTVMDTPGTYSLDPKSPDERVTAEAIFNHKEFGHASVVVAVADGTHLGRQLLITHQLLDAGFRVVLAVTMADLLKEHGDELDHELLSKELGVKVVALDGRLGGGVQDLIEALRTELQGASLDDVTVRSHSPWAGERVEDAFRRMQALAARVIKKSAPVKVASIKTSREAAKPSSNARERTRKIDRWLLDPKWGLFIFAGFMTLLFSSIFWAAQPAMDAVDGGFTWLAAKVLALGPENLVLKFISEGVITSLSSVMVFVPQIFILFVGIILLEDSGYLARSATLVDRPLAWLGLGGRSFVPILSGYACAVPAMMAARTINSRRERWLTLFILPLMSCSARLPVYALLLAFVFHGASAWKGGVALALIYFGSLIVGAIAALIAGRFLKIEDRSFFMMELPVYRRPRTTLVMRQAWTRTKSYVKRAGPPIFLFALIVWLGTRFPNFSETDPTKRLETSYAAEAGRVIEPVFRPMGGDWRTGVGLMSAFAAREVFVSSLAVVFQVAEEGESMQSTLLNKMHDAKAPDGLPLFTIASVAGLVIFFMIALQCLSTVTIAVRESGSLKFALMQLVVFNLVAYVLAVGVVQGLRAFGVQ